MHVFALLPGLFYMHMCISVHFYLHGCTLIIYMYIYIYTCDIYIYVMTGTYIYICIHTYEPLHIRMFEYLSENSKRPDMYSTYTYIYTYIYVYIHWYITVNIPIL